VIVWIGIVLILITGLVHLIDAPDAFEEMTYKGLLFVANGVGAAIAAIGIYRGVRNWGWTLGLVVAAGALVAYILSRTVGLPGLPAEPDAWLEPLGVISLLAEAAFTALALWLLNRPALSAMPRRSLES
jgi:hypothetical protein